MSGARGDIGKGVQLECVSGCYSIKDFHMETSSIMFIKTVCLGKGDEGRGVGGAGKGGIICIGFTACLSITELFFSNHQNTNNAMTLYWLNLFA